MKNLMTKKNAKGFSLIELLVSVGIFTVVTGAAFMLYQRHQVLFSQEQDVVALSLSVRNALSQIQTDMSNAGSGVFPGGNVPNWPVGVTVINSAPGGGCNPATQTYDATCFDTMHIIAADLNVNPVNPTNAAGGCMNTTTGTVSFMPQAGLTPAQSAALYRANDVILFLSSGGTIISAARLTANGVAAAPRVQLSYVPTAPDGTGADPFQITAQAPPAPNPSHLGTAFCGTDWMVKLRGVTYQVDVATDPRNPRLTRTQDGVTDVVTDQVIGFKVGVSLWNQVQGSSTEAYNFDASTYGNPAGTQAFNYTLIRSVRLMMVGRTRPSTDPGYRYRNQFDNGPYQIQPVSLIVNPRNLSIRD